MVMAGGTGGHVFPALSVAEELRARGKDVCWLGTRRGIEARLVPSRQFPLHYIDIEGLRGKSAIKLWRAPLLLWKAVRQAKALLAAEQPDAVIGFGGFASGPGGLAARLAGIPLLIHEQNAIAGTTNKFLARLAQRVLTAFPGVLPRAEWVGNPVRPEIAALAPPAERIAQPGRRLRMLVLGGSLGAQALNTLVPQALARLPASEQPLVRHQCGEQHLENCRQAYVEAGVENLLECEVEPFIEDMAAAYSWADFVICRAGALTISELTAAGLGAILIPFPYAIDDHQTRNGQWLAEQGAAKVVPESWLSPERLAVLLQEWLQEPWQLLKRAEQARAAARNDAAQRVVDACLEVCGD